ncbi:diphosphomevalonate decarboxylase [Enterococcus cecorum]|uniref:diphosphomevalonate decarboxylase n=1 Tax=Enterococcus cecorum TaxID=44008 RepID=UPI001FAD16A1|nr:diphosphomevalonate decarboxylase [Enterococcus cecorum]MCJ0538681.1 diphosphomevalonate decarboxylase [Enterococcus cecorum]MCJ0546635.1 diphosphomevalonate decarboxylase [Enterococcus cecorum]MCJ0551377.1 diphosphomevalonate decarboxylase [Enterococcus cecorum]MCJ0569515.1 diphosphomevalonate decarboxylase [Enterococcus cecorum]
MYKGKARAHTNIALIKYWGKADEKIILPKNNSLSLTLDAFYTETSVCFDESLTADCFTLDGVFQDEKATQKVSNFLDLFRQKANCSYFAKVESTNHVPTAAGLASSASGLCALAGACNQALGLGLSQKELSKMARKGSGSACRSVYGGFVEWEKGYDDDSSYAVPVDSAGFEEELAMIFIVVNQKQKKVSSRDGMKSTVETSSFYPVWLQEAPKDLQAIKQAILAKDFTRLGQITEANALKMHACTLAAVPPFTYWNAESMLAMDAVRNLREAGLECYFTMDAGPNVKVLCQKKDEAAILAELSKQFRDEQLIIAHAGVGIEYLEMEVSK